MIEAGVRAGVMRLRILAACGKADGAVVVQRAVDAGRCARPNVLLERISLRLLPSSRAVLFVGACLRLFLYPGGDRRRNTTCLKSNKLLPDDHWCVCVYDDDDDAGMQRGDGREQWRSPTVARKAYVKIALDLM